MGVALKKRSRRSTISLSSSRSSSSSPSSSISCSPSLESNSFMKSILFTRWMALILAAASFLSLATFLYASRLSTSPSLFYSFEIVKELPHDETAFTQGLLYGGSDTFYESTGFYGKSSVRRVHLQTGKVLDIHHMDSSYFGEGLTLSGERLLQVTWLTQTGFMYDKHNLSQLGTFTHHMKDGWGLATDGKIIFGSDGTSTLYKLDANTLKGIGETTVKYNDIEILYLNELEYINGEVWANVWMSDCIARISPKTGSVLGWILLHKLRQDLYASGHNGIDVLNGIAWDAEQKRLFVTGKLWPKLYEIKLQPLKEHYEDIVTVCPAAESGQCLLNKLYSVAIQFLILSFGQFMKKYLFQGRSPCEV